MTRLIRAILIAAALIAISYSIACSVIPARVDRSRNAVYGASPFDRASDAAHSMLNNLFIADLHADSLIWNRDLLRRNVGRGQVDVPRLRQSNVAIQIFSVPTKVPKTVRSDGTSGDQLNLLTVAAVAGAWPPRTWWSLTERAVYQAQRLHDFAARSDGALQVITTAEELDRFARTRGSSRRVGGILAIEGLHALDGKVENVDRLYDCGYRMMGLVHQFDNALGGSSTGVAKQGLTPFGTEVVRRLEKRSIVIDLAHASPQLVRDVTAIATRPLVVSHTGVRGTCNRNRNISDEEIRRVAATGGVIGIGYWSGATCGSDAHAVARAIHHAVSVAGIDHVALGSDFDGDRMPFDATGVVQVVDALIAEGFSEEEIAKISGGNVLRVLRATLPATHGR
ncbi:MAG TPA: membrane dipeptidase [Thermoanaerobaculia bacterium]